MIIYHKNQEIDRELWDNCIRNSGCLKPYPYSWYLDIMAPGWEALVDDDYDSVFPLPVSSKFGIRYIATPIFLQQLGAFSPDNPEGQAVNEFLDYIPEFYKLIDLNIAQRTHDDSFMITGRDNYELDLSKPYEKLYGNFSAKCKRDIEHSYKNEPEIVNDITPGELTDLFILNKGRDLKGIKPGDYQRLRNLMNFCLKNKKGTILGVRDKWKKPVYGIFIVETKGYKTLLFIVHTHQSREKRIGYYTLNRIIRENSPSKTIIDFAGSSIPEVARFIESFGAVRFPYYRIYRNRLLWPLRMLK